MTNWTDRRSVLALLLIQVGIFLLIRPHGDFPLNDDWAYALSAKWLLSEGWVRLPDWIAPNLLPQTLLGGAVTAIAGFSFEALRHVTQFIALLTSFVAIAWFRAAGLSALEAFVATLVLLAMPSWAVLANSYMSDLYGLLLALASAACFARALDRRSAAWILAGTVLAMAGVLQRQVILVIPGAFLLAWAWQLREWRPKALIAGALPVAATFLAAWCYHLYLETGPGLPEAQAKTYGKLVPLILRVLRGEEVMVDYFTSNLTSMIGYMGWFLCAWCAWWGVRIRHGLPLVTAVVASCLLAAFSLLTGWLPPYLDNRTVDAAGIGPFTLYDALPRSLVTLDRSPGWIWPVAGLVASLGMVMLCLMIAELARRLRHGRDSLDGIALFALLVVLAYLAPFLFNGYFDRYLLLVLPFLCVLWAKLWPRPVVTSGQTMFRTAAVGYLCLSMILAGLATHDYFEWNRARWDAIRHAESLGATPDTLDGGFEYNGYYLFDEQPRERRPGKSWWWVRDDAWVVSFSELKGYDVVRRYPVRAISSRTPPEILLSRRESEKP